MKINYEFLFFVVVAIVAALSILSREIRTEWAKDLRLWFTPAGREFIRVNNYMKHFHYSGLIASGLLIVFFWFNFSQFKTMKTYELGALFLLGGFFMNIIREAAITAAAGKESDGKTWKIPISFRDCRYGGYGFSVYGMVAVTIIKIIMFNIAKN